MAFCANCGHEVGPDNQFCENCGAPIEAAASGAPPAGPTDPTGGAMPPPPSGGAPGGSYGAPPPPPTGGYGQPGPAGPYGAPPPYGSAPPAGGAYGTPPPYGAYPQGAPQTQRWIPGMPGPLADWWPRVLGFLLDAVLLLPLWIVAVILGTVSNALEFLILLADIAGGIWFAVQVGQTGQSPGMRVVGLRCLNINTAQPIGGGLGVVRSIAHFVDSVICYIGYLFPLWDSNRQTLADKIMSTVVVTVPKQPFSLQPPS